MANEAADGIPKDEYIKVDASVPSFCNGSCFSMRS